MEGDNFLFVLHGGGSQIVVDRTNPLLAILTMYDVNESITYITDIPNRRAGVMMVETFIKTWNENSSEKPPANAGFIFYEEELQRYSQMPINLMNPIYDDPADTLTFEITSLDKVFDFNIKELKGTSLFIDYFYSCKEAGCYE